MTPGKILRVANNISDFFSSVNFSKLFTLNFNPTDNGTAGQSNNGNSSFNLPTAPVKPTQISYFQSSLEPTNRPNPTASVVPGLSITSTPTRLISKIPTKIPTKVPKPTRPPDVFPIDPSLARYGKTTDEVFIYASQKTCTPKEVLRAIAAIESGGFFDVVDPKYFLLYNSYDWWNSEFLTEEKRACGGYDYDNGSGIVPSDSKFAGHNCHSDGRTGPNSYIMGPMQIMGREETNYASQVKSALGGGAKQIDRRVILDAILIAGFALKDNVKPTSCSSWSAQQVAKAACSYYGSCGFKDGTYYCNTFCRNYKTYGGKTDCQSAVNQMQDNCWGTN